MIDIVIPMYNVALFIDDCLNSFIEQFDNSFRIILIDDGSVDNVKDLILPYLNEYDFIEYHFKKNGGLSSARNYGLKYCKNDYIWFFDSDDFVAKDAIKKINNIIKKDNPSIIFLEDARFYKNKNKMKYIKSNISKKILDRNDKKEILLHLLKQKRMRVAAWSMIIKRNDFKDEVLFFEENLACEDVKWAPFIVFQAKNYSFIKYPIYCYRVRENSLSHSPINEWKLDSLMNIITNFSYQKYEENDLLAMYLNGFLSQFYLQFCVFYVKSDFYLNEKYEKFIKDFSWILKCGKNFRAKISNQIVKIFGIKGFLKILKII